MMDEQFVKFNDRRWSGIQLSKRPEPIDKKINRIDSIREGTSYTKSGRNPFSGGFWANG